MVSNPSNQYDYIIVGSGAGGGPLAANLAKAGFTVLLLEAGGDPLRTDKGEEQKRYTYSVPAFHPRASEDEDMKWDFFVKHYSDETQQQKDSKYDRKNQGILYPRAGTLGGCTTHNAMITIYPHNSDWENIVSITGDDSWNSDNMRRYFERLEHCDYIERPDNPDNNASRHGFEGWLHNTLADPSDAIKDPQLVRIIISAARTLFRDTTPNLLDRVFKSLDAVWDNIVSVIGQKTDIKDFVDKLTDPNDWSVTQERKEGVFMIPISTKHGKRISTRDYIRSIEEQYPDKLFVQTRALVSKILFAEETTAADEYEAIGVEYLAGKHLYKADPKATDNYKQAATTERVFAKREVIVAGGTFNTPQLLKLSGIGDREELGQFGIPVKVHLPGVGKNLQDRYEVGVVSQMDREFSAIEGATFIEPKTAEDIAKDVAMKEWEESKTGLYTSNGVVIGLIKRSQDKLTDPDLFIFGLPIYFKGYFLKYSEQIPLSPDLFTWAILKAHTNNTAGTVKLRSDEPTDTPEINFHYFEEGNDTEGEDLAAVVEGVKFVRSMSQGKKEFVKDELVPGFNIDEDEEIKTFIKNEAWGHHACGTCKIGSDEDPDAVLDSNFRVRGTKRLRVVDASVFPRIPGFFIVSAIYMVSEKASDVIIQDAIVYD